MADDLNVGLLMFIAYRAMENEAFRRGGPRPAYHRPDPGHRPKLLARRRRGAAPRVTDLGRSRPGPPSRPPATSWTSSSGAGYLERSPRPHRRPRPPGPADRQGPAVQPHRPTTAVAAMEERWTAHLGRTPAWASYATALTRLREITDPYLDAGGPVVRNRGALRRSVIDSVRAGGHWTGYA